MLKQGFSSDEVDAATVPKGEDYARGYPRGLYYMSSRPVWRYYAKPYMPVHYRPVRRIYYRPARVDYGAARRIGYMPLRK